MKSLPSSCKPHPCKCLPLPLLQIPLVFPREAFRKGGKILSAFTLGFPGLLEHLFLAKVAKQNKTKPYSSVLKEYLNTNELGLGNELLSYRAGT